MATPKLYIEWSEGGLLDGSRHISPPARVLLSRTEAEAMTQMDEDDGIEI